jgi:4-amino-4-deoxy-L-arabinose transferase-like glycosyltransferase
MSSALSRTSLAALLLALAAIWFGTLDYRALIRPDEGRYAEIPREMAESGDFVTPRLNGLKYFEKPPLQYWATAIAYDVFGEHNWTARLWPALTGFLGILLAGFTAYKLYGREIGVCAAALLAGMLWYLLGGHFNSLDEGVTFFMGAALSGFLLAQRNGASAAEERRWMLFAWAAMAAAMLSKGLIGVVLPGAVLVLYTLLERDWALWRRLHILPGIFLFLAIAAPWFVICGERNPEFLHFFFIHEHFERYLTNEHNREGSWWYFVPLLVAGVLPWLVHMAWLAPRVLDPTAQARADGAKPFRPERVLAVWIVFIFVFFSASSSKLPSYILPLFPAIALLYAPAFARMGAQAFALACLPYAALVAALMPLIPRITQLASEETPAQYYLDYRPWLFAAGTAVVAGSALAAWLGFRRGAVHAVIALAFMSLCSGLLVMLGHDSLSRSASAYHLVREVVAREGPLRKDLPFYTVAMYEQTLPFYLKRTLTLVDFEDEMRFGLQQEPQKGIPDVEDFATLWRKLPDGYAVMDPEMYRKLSGNGFPMRELGRDTRRVIVSRR